MPGGERRLAGARRPDIGPGACALGFILGATVAYRRGCGFVAARKPGKLPWHTISAEYALEYGVDSLELHADAIRSGARVLVHDDLLATGGTARAKVELVEQLGVSRTVLREALSSLEALGLVETRGNASKPF